MHTSLRILQEDDLTMVQCAMRSPLEIRENWLNKALVSRMQRCVFED